MAVHEPDAAAVATLGAIFVVLTFLSGFLSVRLHDAYRDAVDRQRQLGSELITRSSSLTASLEEDYESTRGSMADALAAPVLVVLAGLVIVGIWLDLSTWRAACLGWLDYRTLTLGLLAFGLAAVASLAFADYWRLRRRLAATIDNSPVHRVLHAEASIAEMWAIKRRLASAESTGEYAYMAFKRAKDRAAREARPALKTKMEKDAARREIVVKDYETRKAVAAGELRRSEPKLKTAQHVLAEVAVQPRLERWGRAAGLRAIAALVEAFDPEDSRCYLSPGDASKIREWLQAAITAEPSQPRWLEAGAFFAEAQGDTAGAATCHLRGRDLERMNTGRAPSLLEPSEESDEQAWVGPREPATFRAVFELERDAGDWQGAAADAGLYLIATFAQPAVRVDREQFEPVIRCFREAIEGLCRDGTVLRLGWMLAEEYLKMNKRLAEQQRQRLVQEALFIHPDLPTQFDQLDQELVAPMRAAADAARSRRDDQRFQELCALYGVAINEGLVAVESRNGSCRLGDAQASLTPIKTKGRFARILDPAKKTNPVGLNITIKAGDFEASVTPGPFLSPEDSTWWVDRFNELAHAAKKSTQ